MFGWQERTRSRTGDWNVCSTYPWGGSEISFNMGVDSGKGKGIRDFDPALSEN